MQRFVAEQEKTKSEREKFAGGRSKTGCNDVDIALLAKQFFGKKAMNDGAATRTTGMVANTYEKHIVQTTQGRAQRSSRSPARKQAPEEVMNNKHFAGIRDSPRG